METFQCPHCGQSRFETLCSDCLAEQIPIQKTRSVFHIGRCHRCGHLDDEPCLARVGSSKMVARAWLNSGSALKGLTHKAANLATRAASAIKANSTRAR